MEKDELMERWNKNGEMRKSENISEKHFRQLHLGMTHRLWLIYQTVLRESDTGPTDKRKTKRFK